MHFVFTWWPCAIGISPCTGTAVATAAAVLASAALALVMRQGGIVAEDADYEEKYQAQAERARERAARARNQEP